MVAATHRARPLRAESGPQSRWRELPLGGGGRFRPRSAWMNCAPHRRLSALLTPRAAGTQTAISSCGMRAASKRAAGSGHRGLASATRCVIAHTSADAPSARWAWLFLRAQRRGISRDAACVCGPVLNSGTAQQFPRVRGASIDRLSFAVFTCATQHFLACRCREPARHRLRPQPRAP